LITEFLLAGNGSALLHAIRADKTSKIGPNGYGNRLMSNRFKVSTINAEAHDYPDHAADDMSAPGVKLEFWEWLSHGPRLPPGTALLVMVATNLALWVAVIHIVRMFWR